MQYRQLGNTGIKVSVLGFGCMRLPQKDGAVDEEEAIRMLRRAYELGVNYFDTAYVYHGQTSEVILGRAIKSMPRDKIYISTKNHIQNDSSKEWRGRLETSLKRLDTDYIDLYLFHGINWKLYQENIKLPNFPMREALRAKEEGLIRHISFSFHDTPENLIKLIDTGDFETVTLQYNILDRSNEGGIAYAKEKGMGVIVMGPVGGGRLGAPSEAIQKLIPGGVKSTAEMALRFVLSNPNVSVALSGMSTMKQLEENVVTASHTEALSAEERRRVEEMLEENKRLADLYCTGCNYCMPCPNGVDIPGNFRIMNYFRVYGLKEYAQRQYNGKLREDDKWANACLECGECEPKCPQNIPIIKQLKETHEALCID
ncbi:MAG: aldo/keto reductase [bacterium]